MNRCDVCEKHEKSQRMNCSLHIKPKVKSTSTTTTKVLNTSTAPVSLTLTDDQLFCFSTHSYCEATWAAVGLRVFLHFTFILLQTTDTFVGYCVADMLWLPTAMFSGGVGLKLRSAVCHLDTPSILQLPITKSADTHVIRTKLTWYMKLCFWINIQEHFLLSTVCSVWFELLFVSEKIFTN